MIHPFSYLESSTKIAPDAIAISSVDSDMSYRELYDTALRFARVFRDLGLKPGDVVAIHAQPIVNLVVAQALFHEACIGTELPSDYDPNTNGLIDWIVVTKLIDGFDPQRQIVLNNGFFNRVTLTQPIHDPIEYENEDSFLRINFSSGTTGVPKPMGVSIRCMFDRAVERRHQWRLDSPYLCLLGLAAGLTFMDYYAAIKEGETFLLTGHGKHVLEQIEHHKVKCVMGSPHQLAEMLRHAENSNRDLASITTVMSAGSVLPDAIAERINDLLNVRVVATYASSEAGSTAIRDSLGSDKGYAGRLLDDVDVRIFDDQGNELPDGEIGLIAIKRAHQPQEYLGDSETTALAFKNGYFYPGDTGCLIGRDLYLAGRKAEIINAAGVKIDPARLDSVALEFPGIIDAASFSSLDEFGLEAVGMFIVADKEIEKNKLYSFLASKVGESAPTIFALTKSIPRNHMGKVNRVDLAQIFASSENP